VKCLEAIQERPNTKFSIQIISHYKSEFEKEKEQGRSWASRVPMHGLFLISISELFSSMGKDNELLSIFKRATDVIKQEFNIADIIVKRTKLSTGLNNENIIYDEHGIKSIQDSSRIELDLKSNKGVFPPYFIYMYTERNLSNEELHKIKELIGEKIAEEINKFLYGYKEVSANV
jgi:hypothetical protein